MIGWILIGCILVITVLQIGNRNNEPDNFTLFVHTLAFIGMVVFGILQIVEWIS